LVSAEEITYGYPETGRILGPITLDFPDGTFTALVGPSGCGKTTFLEILAGQREPTGGDVIIRDTSLYPRKRLFRDGDTLGISMIFQDALVFPWMTALENVEFVLSLRGIKKTGDRAMHWLTKVGLGNDFRKYPSQLSGGMVQRLGLARAMACEPRLLLMDEPFCALDPNSRSELHAELLSLWSDSRCTAILVTHDLDEAVELADRIVLISGSPGRVSEIIPVRLERPRSRFETDYQDLYGALHHSQLVH